MKKLFVMSLCISMFSCYKTEIKQAIIAYEADIDHYYDAAHLFRKRNYSRPCFVPGSAAWSCKFLSKYDETIWEDSENYYSNFSDIKFLNRNHFISFFNIDNDVSYCKGWRRNENEADGKRWNIKFKKDEEDFFSFDYDYYGDGDEIEYSITYTYEVIDGLLHFSSNDDQTFIFRPSDKKYLKGSIDTDEIIQLEGCTFL